MNPATSETSVSATADDGRTMAPDPFSWNSADSDLRVLVAHVRINRIRVARRPAVKLDRACARVLPVRSEELRRDLRLDIAVFRVLDQPDDFERQLRVAPVVTHVFADGVASE